MTNDTCVSMSRPLCLVRQNNALYYTEQRILQIYSFAFFNDSRLCLVLKSFWGNYCVFMIHFNILNTDPVRRITDCVKRHSILKELLKRHSRHSSYLSIISPVVCRLATLFPLMVLALIALRSEWRTFRQQTNHARPNVNTFYHTIKGEYYFTLSFFFIFS